MRRSFSFISGVIVGAMLFGGTAAYAAGILAERSTCSFYLDGSPVEIEAYMINGNNYVKLRDVGELVDFGVSWDGSKHAAMIDTSVGYTPEGVGTADEPNDGAPAEASPERVDHAKAANAAIFTGGVYTREVYNAIRQAILGGETYPFTIKDEAEYWAVNEITAALGAYPGYSIKTVEGGTSQCESKYPSAYAEAAEYTDGFIRSIADQTQAEQVREIAFYVCDRLTYDAGSTSTPRTALTSDGVLQGNCMSYAHNFMFLCNLAEIPCVFVHSEDHQWNQVYVDGQWWYVDVTGDDMENDPTIREWITILHKQQDMQGSSYVQTQPELTVFAKELLVPGSTK